MKKNLLFLVSAILFLSVTACGGGKPSVKITNSTKSITICHFYISAAGSGNWGDDLLQGSQIAPGANQTVNVDAGTYDMKISDCNGGNEATRNAQDVNGPIEWSLEQAGSVTSGSSVKIINNTQSITVCHFYISAAGSSNWGSDLLQGSQIAPGADQTVNVDAGTYDMKVSDCNGANELTRNAQDINGPVDWSLGQEGSGTYTLNVVNNTKSFTFCFLYASTDTSNWGDDYLQGAQIKPGETYSIEIKQPGIYNLKGEDCNHANPVTQQAQDFSKPVTVNWTLTEKGLAPTDKVILRVQNKNATTTICFLYIGPSGGAYGDDVLRGTQIAPGGTFDVTLAQGTYRAKAMDCAQTGQVLNENLDLTKGNTIWTIQ